MMSDYYLGDPCYVIPDDEWGDFCNTMNYDGEDFEFNGETCRVVGTGGDGDFGGLSVDAGIIGVIPVSLCDPQQLKNTVPSNARLISNFAELEYYDSGGIVVVDGDAINGYQCECSYCAYRKTEWFSDYDMIGCENCGCLIGSGCIHFTDEGEYCSEECAPEPDEGEV